MFLLNRIYYYYICYHLFSNIYFLLNPYSFYLLSSHLLIYLLFFHPFYLLFFIIHNCLLVDFVYHYLMGCNNIYLIVLEYVGNDIINLIGMYLFLISLVLYYFYYYTHQIYNNRANMGQMYFVNMLRCIKNLLLCY